MDFATAVELTEVLEHDLIKLKEDPSVIIPTIIQVLEWELNQLKAAVLTMAPDVTLTGVDGLVLIDRLVQFLELDDAESLKVFKNQLLAELRIMKFSFFPPLRDIEEFIPAVVRRLDQKLAIESSASAGDSQVVDGSSSSDHNTQGQGSGISPQPKNSYSGRNLEWYIDFGIKTKLADNPQDFCADKVIEHLRRLSDTFGVNVDDEDVKGLIVQKCNEAIEKRDKILADQGDGERGTYSD